jgi:hypothetical protein
MAYAAMRVLLDAFPLSLPIEVWLVSGISGSFGQSDESFASQIDPLALGQPFVSMIAC